MREVRDELCKMAPESWKLEITEAIDLEIFDQVSHAATYVTSWLHYFSDGWFVLSLLSYVVFSPQLLKSGNLDMDYLGKIMEFALVSVQKLSAAANENKLKEAHQKVLIELAEICHDGNGSNYSHVVALIKGLCFVLEQIKVCVLPPNIFSGLHDFIKHTI